MSFVQSNSKPLYLRQLSLGPMKNFVYLFGAAQSRKVAVVDPAWDVPAIFAAIEADGRELEAVFLTHHHADHLNGLESLLSRQEVPTYVQRAEVDFASVLAPFRTVLKTVNPGEVVSLGPLHVTCIHTPGHTPGSQCILSSGALLSGDTLFVNACGRCDLPGGDARAMYDSLHRILAGLSGETVLYPGHDYGDVPVSSLLRERTKNVYFQSTALPDFLRRRMHGLS